MTVSAATSPSGAAVGFRIDRLLIAILAATAIAKLWLVFAQNINWDEFYYLSQVHDWRRGTLDQALQTLHVHLFGWLTLLPGNEVSQIIAARLVYFGLHLATTALLYAIARRVFDRELALLCTFFYFSFSFVVDNATSFRTDGLAVFLVLAAVHLLLLPRRSWPHLVAAGTATALAGLVTIKSVFYLPVFGLFLLAPALAGLSPRRLLLEGLAYVGSAALAFGALYLLHGTMLDIPESGEAVGYARGAAAKVILLNHPFPQLPWLVFSFRDNAFIWLLLLPGLVSLVIGSYRPENCSRHLLLLGFALPLLTFAVYRNAFPYYYVFAFPLPLLLCGLGLEALDHYRKARSGGSGLPYKIAAVAGTVVMLTANVAEKGTDGMQTQRRVIEAVHQMFPEPLPYIDRNSMIASFPKVGFFMSSWGLEKYRDRGRPIFRDRLLREAPVFLIANTSVLEIGAPDGQRKSYGKMALFEEDWQVLRENYIPHWGPIFVAGKAFAQLSAEPRRFEVLIPGTYTLEAAGPVAVDGRTHQPGAVLTLERGSYEIANRTAARFDVRLRWGENLTRPAAAPPTGEIYAGF